MKRLFAALAPLVLAASAFAAEVQRTFEIEVTGPESATAIRAMIDATARGVPAAEASNWDAAKLGPFDIVAQRTRIAADVRVLESGVARVVCTLTLDDANLPSGIDAADAFAARLVKTLQSAANAAIDAIATDARNRLEATVSGMRTKRVVEESELRVLEDMTMGVPTLRLQSATDRLLAAERDAAAIRIDRTVAAKQLETARAAAQRAVELGRLRSDADAIERRIEQTRDDATRGELRSQLAELRSKIDDGAAKCPSLDTARERVFDLEVELIGLEARETALGAECTKLHKDVVRLIDLARQHAAGTARVEDLRRREQELKTHAEEELRQTPRTTARLLAPPHAPK